MSTFKALIILSSCFMLMNNCLAQTPVRLVGHFADKAVLIIDGGQQILSINQTSPEGIRLISIGTDNVTIEENGQRRLLGFTSNVTTDNPEPDPSSVTILADNNGSFISQGTINGQLVNFLVDTGATTIALNADVAKRLGIDYRKGQPLKATTASGVVPGYGISLDRVSIGEITLYNIPATVLEGQYPLQVLLGMSFLKHVDIQRKDNLLQLSLPY